MADTNRYQVQSYVLFVQCTGVSMHLSRISSLNIAGIVAQYCVFKHIDFVYYTLSWNLLDNTNTTFLLYKITPIQMLIIWYGVIVQRW